MAERAEPRQLFKRYVTYPLQAAGAYLLFAGLRRLSVDTCSAMGGGLFRRIGPRLGLSGGMRRNLKRTFPDWPEAEIERVVAGAWENLGRTIFEYPHLDRLRCVGDGAEIEVVGTEHMTAVRDAGGGGLMVSGHFANWEVMNLAVLHCGVDLHLIYRAPNNPLVDRLFRRRQPGKGEHLPKGTRGARRAMALLKQGQFVGMLVDQRMNDGIAVPFFGRDAMTAPALAQLALRYHCPVVPARCERLGGARFRVTFYPPMEIRESGDRTADVLAVMTRVNAMLEDWVRARPEQWLWVHKRWPEDRRDDR